MATANVPPFNTIPTSDEARAVERLTRTGPDTITYEITYTDPKVFTPAVDRPARLGARRQVRDV